MGSVGLMAVELETVQVLIPLQKKAAQRYIIKKKTKLIIISKLLSYFVIYLGLKYYTTTFSIFFAILQ